MAAPVSRRWRVVFAGTPAFASVALEALVAAGQPVVGVLTQPDRPAGRGLALQASEVKRVAVRHGIPVAQPRGLRLDGKWADDAAAARDALQGWAPDVLVVAAYGLILPAWTLALPPHGALNIHASLLPRWRGAAPIHRAVEAGDAETGITIMQMDEGLDTGATLLQSQMAIGPHDTTGTVHDRLADLGARLIVEALDRLQAGALAARPQPLEGVTYAHKIDKAEATIDWSAPAAVIERRVRAFDPAPGASTRSGGELLKVWRAEVVAGAAPHEQPTGTVLAAGAQGIEVACDGGTCLRLSRLQRPGGRPLEATIFLSGHPVRTGDRLG